MGGSGFSRHTPKFLHQPKPKQKLGQWFLLIGLQNLNLTVIHLHQLLSLHLEAAAEVSSARESDKRRVITLAQGRAP